jgi:hypothetical protein
MNTADRGLAFPQSCLLPHDRKQAFSNMTDVLGTRPHSKERHLEPTKVAVFSQSPSHLLPNPHLSSLQAQKPLQLAPESARTPRQPYLLILLRCPVAGVGSPILQEPLLLQCWHLLTFWLRLGHGYLQQTSKESVDAGLNREIFLWRARFVLKRAWCRRLGSVVKVPGFGFFVTRSILQCPSLASFRNPFANTRSAAHNAATVFSRIRILSAIPTSLWKVTNPTSL